MPDKVILKANRERSALRGHPWIFSGAVQIVEGNPENGATVEVFTADGRFVGKGAYSPHSQIRVRLWTFDPEEQIDSKFFKQKIEQAQKRRQLLNLTSTTNAFRLISAEADGLPGLIVDRYDQYLVCQFLSSGVEFWKEEIINALKEVVSPTGIFERSDVSVRRKEGLKPHKGSLWGKEPPDQIEISENGLKFLVDVKNGHKTGFYLDQRENRQIVRSYCQNKEVLNCFAYTGGFGLAALKGGAKAVTNIEDVAGLLHLITQNVKLNDLPEDKIENIKGDVFNVLRQFERQGRQFDVVILDPPKFADSQAQLKNAIRGYKDINRLSLKILKPGGYLFTFSCSGLMKPELFFKTVSDAALESGRPVQLLRNLQQSADHPILLHIPETFYLKGLLCRVW